MLLYSCHQTKHCYLASVILCYLFWYLTDSLIYIVDILELNNYEIDSCNGSIENKATIVMTIPFPGTYWSGY